MTGPGCTKKHTPIVSKKQQRLFGAVAGGKSTKASGLSVGEAKRHLRESKGGKLPESMDKSVLSRRAKALRRRRKK